MVRRSVLLAVREAARVHLTQAEREAILTRLAGTALDIWKGEASLPETWYPDQISLELVEAVHAELPPARFDGFVDTLVEVGFGRIRRFFLGFATPVQLASRAPEFWRYDHTTGEMTTAETNDGIIVRILAHPYVRSEPCRHLMEEYIRHAVSLTRVKAEIASRSRSSEELRFLVRWS